jgi:hypothetical protein
LVHLIVRVARAVLVEILLVQQVHTFWVVPICHRVKTVK